MSGTPRAFDPQRLLAPLRESSRACAAAAVLALFAGAAVARLAIPNELVATATVSLPREPHAIVSAAKASEVLESAASKAGYEAKASALRERLGLAFVAPDRFTFTVRGEGDESALRRFADALADTYAERANARARAAAGQDEPSLAALRSRAQQAESAAKTALAREGSPDLEATLQTARAELSELERQASEASAQAAELASRAPPAATPTPNASSAADLAEAQRELSRLLAEHGPGPHPAMLAAQQRIERLQARAPAASGALRAAREAEARQRRARELAERVGSKRLEVARLEASHAQVAPLLAAAESARAALEVRERGRHLSSVPEAAVTARAEVQVVDRRAARIAASLLTPAIALLSLFGLLALRELRGFRVRSASELAYWADAPTLATSTWPRREEALELLVDAIADPALAARGVTLLVPLSDLERPLTNALAAQLNARAQRHYRSATGSRVTIAQPWMGELANPRIRRAAEAADRVLWIVAADAHEGSHVRQRARSLGRTRGVAAVLVDGDACSAMAIGDASAFWAPPSPATTELTPARAVSR